MQKKNNHHDQLTNQHIVSVLHQIIWLFHHWLYQLEFRHFEEF